MTKDRDWEISEYISSKQLFILRFRENKIGIHHPVRSLQNAVEELLLHESIIYLLSNIIRYREAKISRLTVLFQRRNFSIS